MKAFLILISAFIGLNFKNSPIICTIVILIYLALILYRFSFKHVLFELAFILTGIAISFIAFDFQRTTFKGLVIESKENYIIVWSKFEKLYLYSKNNNFEFGDIISFSGQKNTLNFITLESQFNFNNYLQDKGIQYQISLNGEINTIFSNPIKLKALRNNFLLHFDENVRDFIGSLLFGDNTSSQTSEYLSSLRISRLASISGIYVYAFLSLFEKTLFYKCKEKNAKMFSFFLLSPYLFFTFPKFSIIRISFIFIFRFLNKYKFKKKIDDLSLLSLSALFFLLFDYHLAYQDAFILGFSIPFLIKFISPWLNKYKSIKKKIILTLIIYVYFIPFELSYYQSFSPISLIYQAIFSPLFILIAVFSLSCFYGVPLFTPTKYLVNGATNLLGWFSKIDISIYAPKPSDAIMLIYYLIFFFLLVTKLLDYRFLFKPAISILIGVICLYSFPLTNFVSEEVSFINVGQGDCCLIRKGLTVTLIDTGGSIYQDIAKDCLIPYLKSKRIYKIDYLIITHDDYDHSGAKESLCKSFIVKQIIADYNSFPFTTNNGITFTNYNTYPDLWKEENDSSLVIGYSICDYNFLVMGDATIKIEKEIIKNNDIDCDVIKVGHHGSDTSTSDAFLDSVNPKEAVISVGKNYYGHPSDKILTKLKKRKIIIRRTDKEGTIAYYKYCS